MLCEKDYERVSKNKVKGAYFRVIFNHTLLQDLWGTEGLAR